MSDPFRSELAALQEKLRRADETIAELRAEKKQLEDERPYPRRHPWQVLFLLFALAGIGATISWAVASVRSAHALEQVHDSLSICGTQLDVQRRELDATQESLEACTHALTPPAPAPAQPIDAGTPGALDRSALVRALTTANVAPCWQHDYGTAHVIVTFQPNGHVSDAKIDAPIATADEQACVKAAFGAVSIPPFIGEATSVGKSYSANKVRP